MNIPEQYIVEMAQLIEAYRVRLMLLPKEPYSRALDHYKGTVVILAPPQIRETQVMQAITAQMSPHVCGRYNNASSNIRVHYGTTNIKYFYVSCVSPHTLTVGCSTYIIGVIRVHEGAEHTFDKNVHPNQHLPEEYVLKKDFTIQEDQGMDPGKMHWSDFSL